MPFHSRALPFRACLALAFRACLALAYLPFLTVLAHPSLTFHEASTRACAPIGADTAELLTFGAAALVVAGQVASEQLVGVPNAAPSAA